MDYVISNGQVSPANLVLTDGDTLNVLSGGTASGVTLGGTSSEIVQLGGTASGNVLDGGVEFVYLGGIANLTTISAGAQAVYGSAVGTIVDGGTLNVSSGGSTGGVTINGGTETIYKSGSSFGTVISDGRIYVSSGGKELGATLLGGAVYVYKGGQDLGATIGDGGLLTVSSGGTASAATVQSGGSINVTAAGLITDVTIQAGGSASAYTGGTIAGATVAAGGTLFAITGGGLAGSIGNSGDIIFSLASTTNGTTTSFTTTFGGALSGSGTLEVLGNGGKLILAGSDTATGGTIINYGSILELTSGGAAGTGPITFSTNSGTLVVDNGAPTNVISGFQNGGSERILLNALSYTSGATSVAQSGDVVTVTTSTGSATLNIANSHLAVFSAAAGANGAVQLTSNAPCFVAGTRIATPAGEVPVESLAAGDLVNVRGGTAAVEWVGHGASRITEANRSDVAPVIVRQGALGDGVPRRDLYLTRRHAVLVGDVLVPVELLVNDRSVVWDDDADFISFHHVELAGHDILLAEGAPAESFRDDGSEHLFPNATSRRPGKPPVEPCFPVVTTGPRLEQAWRSVAERAGALPVAPVTAEPDLHLLQHGQRIAAYTVQDGMHRFKLQPGGDVMLRSRHAIPGAFQEGGDERRLGVALLGIEIGVAGGRVRHGPDVLEGGMHPPEQPGHRWTKGRAVLPATLFDGLDGEIDLALHVAGTVSYRAPLIHELVH